MGTNTTWCMLTTMKGQGCLHIGAGKGMTQHWIQLQPAMIVQDRECPRSKLVRQTRHLRSLSMCHGGPHWKQAVTAHQLFWTSVQVLQPRLWSSVQVLQLYHSAPVKNLMIMMQHLQQEGINRPGQHHTAAEETWSHQSLRRV